MNIDNLHLLARTWGRLALLAWLTCQALPGAAQYKVIGPDGSVSYTDRPQTANATQVTPLGRRGGGSSTSGGEPAAAPSALPQELRQTAAKFPVTLYSTADCAPCDTGRQLLTQRGVPFVEKQVVGEDDAVALERLFGARTVPTLTIGKQAMVGLSQREWSSYLDIAGYPRESKLPKDWQPSPATPLVARSDPAPAPPPLAPARPPVPAEPVLVQPSAPGGIRF